MNDETTNAEQTSAASSTAALHEPSPVLPSSGKSKGKGADKVTTDQHQHQHSVRQEATATPTATQQAARHVADTDEKQQQQQQQQQSPSSPRQQQQQQQHDNKVDEGETESVLSDDNWSVATSNDNDNDNNNNNNNNDPPTRMSAVDIQICQQLDQEYTRALEEREIAYTARYHSVRQSAAFSVVFMAIYLTLGVVFFMQQTQDWGIANSLLFSIYTITTVGYGNLENPETPSFQLYTIFFIFIGIATLTIMVAQVYQCVALEASRAQHARDSSEMARRGVEILARTDRNHSNSSNDPTRQRRRRRRQQQRQQTTTPNHHGSGSGNSTIEDDPAAATIPYFPPAHPWMDRLLLVWERSRIFFRDNEYGRGISVLFPFVGLVLIGAIIIGPIERWTVVESLYFSVVSLTTVGFGDYYPTRKASIYFCILWLPFSIGFMSLFLAKVAAFYIRLSDKNIERIERHLRRQMEQAKAKAEREREAARRRALRGQEHQAPSSPQHQHSVTVELGTIDENKAKDASDSAAAAAATASGISPPKQRHRKGFDTVPTDDDDDESPERERLSSAGRRQHHHDLFGSKQTFKNRRELILMNSDHALSLRRSGSSDDDDNSSGGRPRQEQSSMTTMRDVLRTVRRNVAKEETSRFRRAAGPESEFLSIRSSQTVQQTLERSSIRKPSFGLRALVQERFSEIIATDIAGYSSNIEIKENTLSVTIKTLKQTADKWLVPRRARKAFRAVAFEALYFVGEHGLITRGADALYDLTTFEFHGLFAPLLAAMGDAETMEGWLASTEVLAEVDLKRDHDAKEPPNDIVDEERADGTYRRSSPAAELNQTDQSGVSA